jgi:NAD-dependent aldehyde dehydrogenases
MLKLFDKRWITKRCCKYNKRGFADTCSKFLTSHPKINKIAFTGGVHTAKHIVRNSAENLSQISLELGGKSPVVVFKDARKDNAINGIMASIFGASGQSCIARFQTLFARRYL